MYPYNHYDDEEEEKEKEEEEEESNKKEKNNESDCLFDDMEEEFNKNNEKNIDIYFPNNNNENQYLFLEEGSQETDNEYKQLLIKEYKLELNKKYIPLQFPRPKSSDLFYNNYNNSNIYLSKPDNYELIPSSISYFKNKEDINSSIKLIRPTQHVIPIQIKGFEKTINIFGFNIQPFSLNNIEIEDNNKEFIPSLNIEIIHENLKISQCLNCKSIYHKLTCYCEKIKNELNYQIYSYNCLICKNKSNLLIFESESKEKINNEIFPKQNLYFIPKIKEIQNISPSIEYLIQNNESLKRNTFQIIIIELNNINLTSGLIEYIYQYLYQIMKENSLNYKAYDNIFKYSLIVYDFEKIYFMHLNNQNTIDKYLEVTIMNDFNKPFCPITSAKLFYNKKDFLILIEKFQNWLLLYKEKNTLNNSIKIDINTLINSLKNLFNDNLNYYHLIVFSFSFPKLDLNFLKNNSHLKLFISLFVLMNKSDKNISFINNIFLHNIKIYYYQILGIKEKCEKIYYDLCSILLNDSYKDYLYDASFIISYDKSIFYNKINKNNEPIFISFLPNKNNLIIINILPQHGYPNSNENILFQFHIKYYTCIDDYLHMRILTWNCTTSNKSKEIFDSYDQDTLFRISLFNIIYDSSIENNVDINIINKIFIKNNNSLIIKIEKILKEKLVNTIIKYRKEVKKEKDFKMIIIPSKIRNFILYYYSFFKQIISREKFLFNSLFNEKIEIFIKNIYPNILNLSYLSNDKKEKIYLMPSTIYYLRRNQLLLIFKD